jgi:hypothetical protein
MGTTASPASGLARTRRWRRGGSVAAVVVCSAMFGAACGSSIPGYAGGLPETPVALAQCMRAHGVPGFPDPSGGRFNLKGINQNAPRFRQAVQVCVPAGGRSAGPSQQAQGLAKGLEFARCMRAHGVRDFPDPVASDGNFVAHGLTGSGMDPGAPVFQAALQTCRPVLTTGGNPGTGSAG